MEKHIVIFSKNFNYCIYAIDVLQEFDILTKKYFYILDRNVVRSSRDFARLPAGIRYLYRIDVKYVFDSKREAIEAVDGLLRDAVIKAMRKKEKAISSLQEDIEKLKVVQAKGRYRNYLANRHVKNKLP